ncbi:MAG: hypothetical protein HC876_07815 [Chloroflexaceae bacterium]|nr:hypothetical protein [Chloroflexaceae bacterium]NJO05419.1 hypothetical protein [Chloroflexaceae bacterium]
MTKNQRRVAKCVAAGTYVNTSNGLCRIEQLGTAPVGDVSTLQLTVAQEGISRAAATGFYNGGIQPTIRIKTARGYVLEATGQHQVRSLDEQGKYIWRQLAELGAGDYVALARGGMVFGTDQPIIIEYQRRNEQHIQLPTRLTPLFARFLGYFVAEGNASHNRTSSTIVISNTDPDVLNDLRRLSRELFTYSPAELVDKNGVTRLSWHSTRMADLLEHLGVGTGAANKRIPAIVMQGSYDSVTEFLRAFFEGDGSISDSFISAGSKSYTLIQQLQVLLLNLGIVGYLEQRDIPEHGRHYKIRLIGRESREAFAEHIHFISTRKRQRLQELLTRQVTHEPIVLPFQRERLVRMYPKTKSELKETIHTCIRTKSPTINLTYRRLGRILSQFPDQEDDDYTVLQEHLHRNLFYDRIVSLEHTESQVYDLVVPENNTYIANGFVSHNTVIFGVIYGISSYGLAQRIGGLGRGAAQELINALFARFPGIRQYIDETLERGQRDGYVQSLFGRRRYMPELKDSNRTRRAAAEREAINAPIQATAADIMKLAMIKMYEALQQHNLATRMLLQVHDELILEVPHAEIETVQQLVREVMENVYQLNVPLQVGVEIGDNWEEMTSVS